MASEAVVLSRRHQLALSIVLSFVCAMPAIATAADAPGKTNQIYRCTDANGKKITSDRPVRECANASHDELNPDGSLKRVVPPPMTDDERAEAEQRDRDAKAAISTKNDWIRRDRNLLQRFPDEATHRKARSKALDEFDSSVRRYQERIRILTDERKVLRDDAEFYGPPPKQPLPNLLKQKIDNNEASLKVQYDLVQGQQDAINRINATYDIELARLKKLWAGALPGSLGPLPGPPVATLAAPDLTKAAASK